MSKKELVDRSDVDFFARPTGWFQIGWTHEYAPGDVRELTYFGTDLVAYRTEAGVLVVAEAHCPHLGAHLAFGGRVEGECLRCPFHGWLWGLDGANVAIPYSTRLNRSKRIVQLPVVEQDGIVFTWFSGGGGPPVGNPPRLPELHDGETYHPAFPDSCRLWPAAPLYPQFILENTVDFAHLKYLHGWGEVPIATLVEETPDSLRTVVEGQIPTPKGTSAVLLDTTAYGIGLIVSRLSGLRDTITVISATPVDCLHTDVRLTVGVQRLPEDGDVVPRVVERIRHAQLNTVFEQDIPVWAHMKYSLTPPYPREEARAFVTMRNWSRRFYPEIADG